MEMKMETTRFLGVTQGLLEGSRGKPFSNHPFIQQNSLCPRAMHILCCAKLEHWENVVEGGGGKDKMLGARQPHQQMKASSNPRLSGNFLSARNFSKAGHSCFTGTAGLSLESDLQASFGIPFEGHKESSCEPLRHDRPT